MTLLLTCFRFKRKAGTNKRLEDRKSWIVNRNHMACWYSDSSLP